MYLPIMIILLRYYRTHRALYHCSLIIVIYHNTVIFYVTLDNVVDYWWYLPWSVEDTRVCEMSNRHLKISSQTVLGLMTRENRTECIEYGIGRKDNRQRNGDKWTVRVFRFLSIKKTVTLVKVQNIGQSDDDDME